ncbi:MAG: LysE family translocator [Pseudomonadota bacterium]
MTFLPDLSTFFAFSLAAIVLAITPGPDMTLFLSRALRHGTASGIVSMLGATVGTMVHTVLAVAGISALIAASPVAFGVLKIVGALYLLWLAYQAVFQGSTFQLDAGPARKPVSLWRSFMTGIGVNLLNPKVVLFFMTFLPQFVTASDPAAWSKMLVLGLYFGVLTAPLMAVMIFAARGFADALQRRPAISRGIDYVFGSIFCLFAVRILFAEGR